MWQFPIFSFKSVKWVNTSNFIYFLDITIHTFTIYIMYMNYVCNKYIIILLLGYFLFISFDSSPSGMK